jgi:hypothetical protein
MSRKIKLIWDFRGEVATITAEHHDIHLKEYLEKEKIVLEKTGFETINEMHAIAFIVVEEKDMIAFRDVLKPHRGELFETKEQ